MKNRHFLPAILAIIFVRLYGLGSQGIFMYDEASYLLEGEFLRDLVRWTISGSGSFETNGVNFGGVARPLHFMLLAFVKSDFAALILMAAFGLGSIALAMMLVPDRARLFLLVIFGLSPSHIFHSRTVLAEVNAAFFVLLSIYLYQRAQSHKRLMVVGSVFALGFALQSRLLFLIPYLLIAEFFLRQSWRRIAWITVGFVIPLVAIQLFYVVLKNASGIEISTYLNQYILQYRDGGGAFRFNEPWFGIRYLVHSEGVVAMALFFGLGIFAIRRREKGLFWFGYALWIIAIGSLFDQDKFSGYRYGRSFAPAIPALSICAALALEKVFANRAKMAYALAVLIIALRLPLLAEITTMKAGTDILQAAPELTHTSKVFSEQPYHVYHYLGRDSYPAVFSPRSDSITVVVMNEGLASCYPFYYILPETPTFTFPGRFRPSRLLQFEEGQNPLNEWPTPYEPRPVKIWVLPPEDTAPIERLF